MKCEKCGRELDDNAVFCDGCGSFVMHGEYNMLPNNGYRERRKRRSRTWVIVLAAAVFAGALGTGLGYGIIENDRRKREALRMSGKPQLNSSVKWDSRLIGEFPKYKHSSAYQRDNTTGNADKKQ